MLSEAIPRGDIAMSAEMREGFAQLRTEIRECKADLLKIMIGLFLPLYFAQLGLLIALFLRT